MTLQVPWNHGDQITVSGFVSTSQQDACFKHKQSKVNEAKDSLGPLFCFDFTFLSNIHFTISKGQKHVAVQSTSVK